MTTGNHQQSGFDRFGITHISPSQVNKAREAFDAWYVEKVLGYRFPTGSSAFRGQAVEEAVSQGLFNPELPIAECIELGKQAFDRMSAMEMISPDDREKELASIEKMVEAALVELRPLGKPARPPEGMKQHMVELVCRFGSEPHMTIKMLGYLDFVFPEHQMVVDLKTTSRLPSQFSATHSIQAAFYKRASQGMRVRFLYVSPKKTDPRFVWFEMDEPDKWLAIVKDTAARMERFLSISDDKQKLTSLVMPKDSFYWRNAKHIWDEVFQVPFPSSEADNESA